MKTKFKNVTQVRKNMITKENWLKSRTKKKDLKCQNCNRLYEILNTNIALIAIPGELNKHVCEDCANHYILIGAEDIENNIIKNEELKNNLINEIKTIGKWEKSWFDKRELEAYKIEELEKMLEKHKAIKEKEDRINSIVISAEDSFIEPYLTKEYNVLQDTKYLRCEEQIEEYFEDCGHDYLKCGQGHFQDEAEVIIKIAKKFYLVKFKAEIMSAKQDVGDRLYWVDFIKKVTWKEIPKPLPKEYEVYAYQIQLNTDQKNQLENFMNKLKLLYIVDKAKV